jgi:DNA-binding beta-propeller fold protein YncE
MKEIFRFCILLVALCTSPCSSAADISNPQKLFAVADRSINVIDVVDVDRGKTVHRIATAFRPDDVVIAPHAPILMYSNIEHRQAVFYNLETKTEISRIELAVTPRHVVLDTSGNLVGISDSRGGGFMLLSLYGQRALFSLPDFPPTSDVLFDPNEVDVYYSNVATGSIGLLDINVQKWVEMPLTDSPGELLSAPSRSLDARYIYVANGASGEVYSLNAYSKVIYRSFTVGKSPARPYTTPQGSFLYMADQVSGRFVVVEQGSFQEFADVNLGSGVNLVAVGRFDRFNLLLGTTHSDYFVFDNRAKKVVAEGSLKGTPQSAYGASDGKTAYIAFADIPKVAMFDFENQVVRYFDATENGAGAATMGLSNNVCH